MLTLCGIAVSQGSGVWPIVADNTHLESTQFKQLFRPDGARLLVVAIGVTGTAGTAIFFLWPHVAALFAA